MPDDTRAIEHALETLGLSSGVVSSRSLGGGHGQSVTKVTLGDGSSLVAKSVAAHRRDMIDAEADGLSALGAAEQLHAPRVWDPVEHSGRVVMLMDWLEPSRVDDNTWVRFGEALATHHNTQARDSCGWTRDNFIGATPQRNTWSNDWVEFNREHRLGYQLGLAIGRGAILEHEADDVRRVIDRLDEFIPREPIPALLHGDLWGGNALSTSINGVTTVALIDPAVYIGDGWADIAMMRLFGGFPELCLDAYMSARGDTDRIESRVLVYQLYHILNHANLFGGAYGGQAGSVARLLMSL